MALMDPQQVWLQTTSLLGDRLTYLVISSGKQIPRLLFFTRWLKAATMEDTPMADLTNLLVQMESIGRTGVCRQWVGSSVIKTQGTGEWIWSLITKQPMVIRFPSKKPSRGSGPRVSPTHRLDLSQTTRKRERRENWGEHFLQSLDHT